MYGCVWECEGVFGSARVCLGVRGCVWECEGVFGSARVCLGVRGCVWIYSAVVFVFNYFFSIWLSRYIYIILMCFKIIFLYIYRHSL